MANVRLLFRSNNTNEHGERTLCVYVNEKKELLIDISDEYSPSQIVELDKSTAIKLSRELRKQISLMD